MLNTQTLYNKYEENDQVLIAYKGTIDDDITSNLLAIAEKKLDTVEYNTKAKKKIFNIMVELLQNIHHNFRDLEKIPSPYLDIIVMVFRTENGYEIYSGNYMLAQNQHTLLEKIERVNDTSMEELRTLYRERLNTGTVTEEGRAGLGIMDMARKSAQPLEYDFEKIDDTYVFFSLKVTINRK